VLGSFLEHYFFFEPAFFSPAIFDPEFFAPPALVADSRLVLLVAFFIA